MNPAFSRFSLVAVTLLLAIPHSHAATYYWDGNNNSSGFAAATGTWASPTSSRWSTSNTGNSGIQSSYNTTTNDDLIFGAETLFPLTTGTVTVSGTVNAKSITFGGVAEAITFTGGTINLPASPVITVNNVNNQTIGSTLTGAATLFTKAGGGKLILTANNSFAGKITVAAGTLAIAGTQSGTGDVTLNGSTFDLGNSSAGGSLASTVLNMNTGVFNFTRTDSATHSFVTTNVNGTYASFTVNTGNTLNLGTVNRTIGATPVLSYAGTGTLAALTDSNVGGIMPGFYSGNSWVTANGAGTPITSLANASYTSTSVAGTTASNYLGANVDVNSSPGVLAASINANTLRFSAAAVNTLTLTGSNTLSAGGILIATSVGAKLSTITGGSLTSAGGRDLHIIQNNSSGGLSIATNIVNDIGATTLTKSGDGLLTLSGANTFTGGLIINAGQVVLGSTSALNSAADSENAITFTTPTTGTLSLNGNSVTLRSLNGAFAAVNNLHIVQNNHSSTAATLTIGNGLNLDSNFEGLIQNGSAGATLALVKKGAGRLIIGGTVGNTYTGGTTIHAGTVVVNNGAALGPAACTLTFAGDSTLQPGYNVNPTLYQNIVINSGVTAKINEINQYYNMTFNGAVSGSGTLWIGSTDNGQGNTFLNNASNTHTGTLRIGDDTRDGKLDVLSLVDGAGPIEFGGTTGTGYLNIYGISARDFSQRTFTLIGTTGGASIKNWMVRSDRTTTIQKNLAITGVGNKTLTLGGTHLGNNAFNGFIHDGAGSIISFTKEDYGRWILSKTANSYSGPTKIMDGILEIKKLSNGGVASSIGLSGNGPKNLIFGPGPGPGPTFVEGILRYTGAGDSTDRNFIMLGNATLESLGSGPIVFSQPGIISPSVPSLTGTFFLGNPVVGGLASTADFMLGMAVTSDAFSGTKIITAITSSTITLNNGTGIQFGTFGFTVGYAANRILRLAGTQTGANTISGILQDSPNHSNTSSPGVLNILKQDAGTWRLDGLNTYTGTTTVTAGTLVVAKLADGGLASSIGQSTNLATNLMLGDSTTLIYTGSGDTTDRLFTINGTLAGHQTTINASGSGPLAFTNTASPAYNTTNQTRTLNLGGANTGDNTLAANIANNGTGAVSIMKNDTGTWALTGTSVYTGATTINTGTLKITKLAYGGSASSIGLSSNSAANLKLGNNSALAYTGSGDTTDRSFTINGTANGDQASLISSGTGPVRFINASCPAYNITNQTRTLILGGTNTGDNILAANIANNGTAAVSVVKNDIGTWILTGNSTYTGDTIVNLGTLRINGSISPSSALIFNGTSTLSGSGGIGGNVTLTANANLSPQSQNSALSIGGNLNISAMTAGTGKLNFGLGPISASDKIAVSGTLDIGTGALAFADFAFTYLNGLENGTYKLMTSGTAIVGSLDPNPANLTGPIGYGGIGTLQISASGKDIELVISNFVPYTNWAEGVTFGADTNTDGISNGLAFMLGAADVNADAHGVLPAVKEEVGALVLNFKMRNAAGRGTAVLNVAHSGDLGVSGAWTLVPVPDTSGGPTNGVTFTVTQDSVDPSLNEVKVTISSSEAIDGRLFSRLQATE